MKWIPIDYKCFYLKPVIVKGFYDYHRHCPMPPVTAVWDANLHCWMRDNQGTGFTVQCYPTHYIPIPEDE